MVIWLEFVPMSLFNDGASLFNITEIAEENVC